MDYISKLVVKGFQCYKDKVELNFSPGVNVILGTSDSGKSAIARAIELVVFNSPGGDSFINHKADKCYIALTKGDKKIVREKSKTKNLYKLDDKEFKGFGTTAPDEIVQHLNFDSINVSDQTDSYYLLTISAGEVAKILNNTVNLNAIDDSRTKINTVIKATSGKLSGLREDLKIASDKLSEFKDLDLLSDKLEVMSKISNDMDASNRLCEELNTIAQKIEKSSYAIANMPNLDVIDKSYSKLKDIRLKKEKLDSNKNNLSILVENIERCEQVIKSYRNKNLKKIRTLLRGIETNRDESIGIKKQHNEISAIYRHIELVSSKILKLEESLKENQDYYNSHMGEVCQLCGQQLKGIET